MDGTGKAALLVLDMQEDICRDSRRRHLVDEMVPTLCDLIDSCLVYGMPVVFSQYWLPTDDAQFRRFGDRYCIENTPGAEIISELRGYLDRVELIQKRKHSAFYETPLEGLLSAWSVDTLAIAGLQTHICIMTTAADASFRGLAPIVLEDCVVSSTATKKTQALDWIATYVGAVQASKKFMELHLGR